MWPTLSGVLREEWKQWPTLPSVLEGRESVADNAHFLGEEGTPRSTLPSVLGEEGTTGLTYTGVTGKREQHC